MKSVTNPNRDRVIVKRLEELRAGTRFVEDLQKKMALDELINLKLHVRNFQEMADVIQLVRHNNLDESFAERLHPSVREFYIMCVEARRDEDERDPQLR